MPSGDGRNIFRTLASLVYMCSVDLEKTYDAVPKGVLSWLLWTLPRLCDNVCDFYGEDPKARPRADPYERRQITKPCSYMWMQKV